MLSARFCEYCNNKFFPNHGKQRYCDVNCRNKASRVRKYGSLENYQKEYKTPYMKKYQDKLREENPEKLVEYRMNYDKRKFGSHKAANRYYYELKKVK